MDEAQINRTTYDAIAVDYAARWATNDDVVAEDRSRFLTYVNPGSLILDMGCGPGRDTTRFAAAGHDVVGLDLSVAMLLEARRIFDGSLVAADMRLPPLRPQTFDAIWACASLLHVSKTDAPRTIERFRSLLHPEGVLFVAMKEGKGEALRESDGHQRFFAFYSAKELANLVEGSGFTVLDAWSERDDVHPDPWLNVIARCSR